MAVYAVGDVQGCYATLQRLLARIRFDPAQDRLWLVGDLVNRGPRSLEVLRWAQGMGGCLTCVIGNHDLHLIGRALGLRRARRKDTLDAVLEAPDRHELIDWLRRRPLLYREGRHLLVHAGLLPDWTLEVAEGFAREAEAALRGPRPQDAIEAARGPWPARWRGELSRPVRLRVALQALTSLRTCSPQGWLCSEFSGPPDRAPKGCYPWFDLPTRRGPATVICGHWSALGLCLRPGLIALDTGCVWGGPLTAVRLEDRAVFQQPLVDRV